MLDERQLALKPIVGESVGHNARVSILLTLAIMPFHSLPSQKRYIICQSLTHKISDRLQHPKPNSIALRCRRRNAGPGIPARVLLLLRGHGYRLPTHVLSQSEGRRQRLLFPALGRFLDRRSVRRLDEFRAHLDGFLRPL